VSFANILCEKARNSKMDVEKKYADMRTFDVKPLITAESKERKGNYIMKQTQIIWREELTHE